MPNKMMAYVDERLRDGDAERPAIGFRRAGMQRLVCAFDTATWKQVRDLADANGVSLAEQVRSLVRKGLAEGPNLENVATSVETIAASYEFEASRCSKPQNRTVPEPQLLRIKAAHWRILAKHIRNVMRASA